MGFPAARLGDHHSCPMVTGIVPHVGGPILPLCEPTVLIGGRPAARCADLCMCVGPMDVIAPRPGTVFIGGRVASRQGDPTVHGGVIVGGLPTVLIGDQNQVKLECLGQAQPLAPGATRRPSPKPAARPPVVSQPSPPKPVPAPPPPAAPAGGKNKLAGFARSYRGGVAASPGYCAKGVMNILLAYGAKGVQRDHAYRQIDKFKTLAADPNSGWREVPIKSPQDAPPGAVILYDRDHPPGATGGAGYGHIEIRGDDGSFVSDKVRQRAGGTVLNNFTGYAYVYEDKAP